MYICKLTLPIIFSLELHDTLKFLFLLNNVSVEGRLTFLNNLEIDSLIFFKWVNKQCILECLKNKRHIHAGYRVIPYRCHGERTVTNFCLSIDGLVACYRENL